MAGWSIERGAASAAGRSSGTACGPFAWCVATSGPVQGDVTAQTRATLERLDKTMAAHGTDKTRILSATVYVASMADKPAMDAVWTAWIGPDPAHWPQRACVQVGLEGHTLVEVAVVALRRGA